MSGLKVIAKAGPKPTRNQRILTEIGNLRARARSILALADTLEKAITEDSDTAA